MPPAPRSSRRQVEHGKGGRGAARSGFAGSRRASTANLVRSAWSVRCDRRAHRRQRPDCSRQTANHLTGRPSCSDRRAYIPDGRSEAGRSESNNHLGDCNRLTGSDCTPGKLPGTSAPASARSTAHRRLPSMPHCVCVCILLPARTSPGQEKDSNSRPCLSCPSCPILSHPIPFHPFPSYPIPPHSNRFHAILLSPIPPFPSRTHVRRPPGSLSPRVGAPARGS